MKYNGLCKVGVHRKSPSVWREWIEIKAGIGQALDYVVSLRVEGVD